MISWRNQRNSHGGGTIADTCHRLALTAHSQALRLALRATLARQLLSWNFLAKLSGSNPEIG